MAIADDRKRVRIIIDSIRDIRINNRSPIDAVNDFILTLGFKTLLDLYESVKLFDVKLAAELLNMHPSYSTEATDKLIAEHSKASVKRSPRSTQRTIVKNEAKGSPTEERCSNDTTEPLKGMSKSKPLKYTEEKVNSRIKARRLPGNRRMVTNRDLVNDLQTDTSLPAIHAWNTLKEYDVVEPWFISGLITHPANILNTFVDLVVSELNNTTPQRMQITIGLLFKLLIGHWSTLDHDNRNTLVNFILTEGSNKDIILINLYFGTAVQDTALIAKSARVFFNYTTDIETITSIFHTHAKLQKRFMRDVAAIAGVTSKCYEEECYYF